MQLNFDGKPLDLVAIERVRLASELNHGQSLDVAYSGGKDSDTILNIVQRSGVPFTSHYCVTGIDPPELVSRIKRLERVTLPMPLREGE